MESALLGRVLDSSILIAAERRKLTPNQAIETFPLSLCSVTTAEIGHGIYRAHTPETRSRRGTFFDELKAAVPIFPVTESTAEIVARIGGKQAAKGLNLPLGDLMIAACALEPRYAIATSNLRDSNAFQD
jgi:predicted nucleic acid-binding protein